MKKLTLSIFALLLCILLGSCSKEELNTAGTGTSFKMSVVATAPQIEVDTKAELHNVIVYSFNNGDAISVVNVSSGTYLGNLQARVDDPSSSTVQKMVTTRFSGELSGSINKGDKLAFIYPAMDGTANTAFEGYSVDLSNQIYNGSTVPFTAYSQMESPFASSDNEAIANDLFISFTNVTSYLVLNIQGMPVATNMDKLTLTRVNNGIDWSIAGGSIAAAPSGDNVEKIVLDCSGKDVKTSSIGAKSLYLAVPACNLSDYRNVIVELGDKRYDSPFSKSALGAGKFYSQNIKVEEYLPYVEIEADYDQDPSTPPTKLRWAKCNIGAETPQDYGYYFFWGGTQGYVYDSVNSKWVTAETGEKFVGGFCFENTTHTDGDYSYSNRAVFTKYVPQSQASTYGKNGFYDDKTTLDQADDAACKYLGGNFRMPTSAEYKAMYEATYWAWDGTDKGYYVFMPGEGTLGSAGDYGKITDTDNKVKALLFFPAAGYGTYTLLLYESGGGHYWSSSLYSSIPCEAHCLYFDGNNVKPQSNYFRYFGFSVRPVSDVPVQSEITNPFGGDEVNW